MQRRESRSICVLCWNIYRPHSTSKSSKWVVDYSGSIRQSARLAFELDRRQFPYCKIVRNSWDSFKKGGEKELTVSARWCWISCRLQHVASIRGNCEPLARNVSDKRNTIRPIWLTHTFCGRGKPAANWQRDNVRCVSRNPSLMQRNEMWKFDGERNLLFAIEFYFLWWQYATLEFQETRLHVQVPVTQLRHTVWRRLDASIECEQLLNSARGLNTRVLSYFSHQTAFVGSVSMVRIQLIRNYDWKWLTENLSASRLCSLWQGKTRESTQSAGLFHHARLLLSVCKWEVVVGHLKCGDCISGNNNKIKHNSLGLSIHA